MASDFWLIVGLGNPGKKYEGTRHNMGFMTADILAERWSVAFSDHKGLAMLGKGAMNLAGSQRQVLPRQAADLHERLGQRGRLDQRVLSDPAGSRLVIHDDMDLEFGRIKVKAGGSAGGHNGIKSIRQSLSTPKYARVRMGVGHAQRGAHAHDNTVNWVLGASDRTNASSSPNSSPTVRRGRTIIFDGLAKAQERFNGR